MGISQQQALDCFASDDLIGIGMEADAVRRRLHPGGIVSYAVDHVVDAGNDLQALFHQIGSAVNAGATSIRLVRANVATQVGEQVGEQGTEAPGLAQFQATLEAIRQRFPGLKLYALSAGEILQLASDAGVDVREALLGLRAAGLDSFAGDSMSGETIDRELLSVHRTAHQLGVRSTAGMVFGAGESLEERVQHLFAIRELQEETGGFTAFTPWSFQPGATTADREEPTAVEYLRTLAIARMVLDNVENIESNCVAQGLKVVQMGLRFGANDTGSIRIESAAKRPASFTEEDLRRVIRDAGFRPVERDTLYQTMYLNN